MSGREAAKYFTPVARHTRIVDPTLGESVVTVVLRYAFLSGFLALALYGVATPSAAQPAAAPGERRNFFDDPFIQVTSGLSSCPPPEGPLITEEERRAQAHYRVERGNSCFQAGRCRLPNAYLYDREIIPRVKKAVDADGSFAAGTSVWAEGQRRWVWLKGCVSSREQADRLEQLVRGMDDVEQVIDELRVVGPVQP